jgi:hypothetical protein
MKLKTMFVVLMLARVLPRRVAHPYAPFPAANFVRA